MDMNTLTPVVLNTIKGTARNKDRRRVWVEVAQSKLEPYGFRRGDRVHVEYLSDRIVVTADPVGSRKVAGRVRKDKTICILDLCHSDAVHMGMFGSADRLTVWVSAGQISITV